MPGIRIELQLSDGSFTSGMLRAGQSLRQFQSELARTDPHFRKLTQSNLAYVKSVKQADKSSRGFLAGLRDVAIVAGGLTLAFSAMTGASNGLIGNIVKINADMERLRFQMEGLAQSSDPIREAATNVAYLREQITKMPFSLNELSSTFVKLRATGTDPMAGSLQAIADGIAAFGGTDEQLHRVTLGITQMSGKSVIQMEEMRQQLGESMPAAMQIMARSMGVSIAELTAAIATGRLQAGPALNAFYAELERTFGGSALRMMETFSGQVTKMRANFQQLATGPGLKSFVDTALKDVLKEFNSFLESDRARIWADELGNLLSSTANRVAAVTRYLFGMRDELILIAKIAAAGIGMIALRSAAGAFMGSVQMLKLSLQGFKSSMATASLQASLFRVQMNGVGFSAATAAATGLLAARTAMMALGSAILAAAPWLIVLGGALVLAGNHFGWFKDKVVAAYTELEKFGAESQEAAARIVEDRIEQLQKEVDLYQKAVDGGGHLGRTSVDNLAEAKASLEKVMASRDGILMRAGEREREIIRQTLNSEINARELTSQEEYRRRVIELQDWQTLQLATTEETGRSQASITKEYEDLLLTAQRKMNQQILDMREGLLSSAMGEDEASRMLGIPTPLGLRERLSALRQLVIDARANMVNDNIPDLNMGPDIENMEAKVARGQKILDDLVVEIAGMRSELEGSDGAMAQLMTRIERGDFGSIEDGGDTVRDLTDALIEATAQKEIMDAMMKGQKDLEEDLEDRYQDLLEERLELLNEIAGTEMNGTETIIQRLADGGYETMGSAERIREALRSAVGITNIQGAAMNSLADVMQENTFGDPTIARIDAVTSAMGSMLGMTGQVKGAMADLSMGIFSDGSFGGAGSAVPMTESDLILLAKTIQAEAGGESADGMLAVGSVIANRARNGNYGQGISGTIMKPGQFSAWNGVTGYANGEGALDMANMTPSAEAMAAARKIMYGNYSDPTGGALNYYAPGTVEPSWGSSAGGEWQNIGNHRFGNAEGSPGASSSAPRYDNAGMDAMIEEFVGMQVAAQTSIVDAAMLLNGPLESEVAGLQDTLAIKDELTSLAADIATARQADGSSNLQALINLIEAGDVASSRDAENQMYAGLIAKAKELDAVEAEMDLKKDARTDADRQRLKLEEDRVEIARKLVEETARMQDPNYEGDTNALIQLNTELTKYVENVRVAFGEDSPEFANAVAQKAAAIQQNRQLEATSRAADMAAERQDMERGLLSKRQQRQLEFQDRIAGVDAWMDRARQAGLAEVEIVRQAEAQKAAIRGEYSAAMNPMIGQMAEWRDFQGALITQSTNWTSNLSSGLAGVVRGTNTASAALSSLINNVLDGLADIAVKGMMAGFSDIAKGASGGTNILTSFIGGMMGVPVAHTGGIVGQTRLTTRMVSPSLFNGAPKFHGGGIVGGPKLGIGEVPVITKKGEGIFTTEQMSSLGGQMGGNNQAISINAPVTVNGSAGTPDQNDDLARKMAREMESTMRGAVTSELRRQLKPGNMLNNGKR